MWQKARITRTLRDKARIGRELWVRAQAPELKASRSMHSGNVNIPALNYYANLTDEDGREMLLLADCVELLPEFAETVALVPLPEWEQQAAH